MQFIRDLLETGSGQVHEWSLEGKGMWALAGPPNSPSSHTEAVTYQTNK